MPESIDAESIDAESIRTQPQLISRLVAPITRTSASTDTEETSLGSVSLPGGTMGPNTKLVFMAKWDVSTTDNTKIVAIDFGGASRRAGLRAGRLHLRGDELAGRLSHARRHRPALRAYGAIGVGPGRLCVRAAPPGRPRDRGLRAGEHGLPGQGGDGAVALLAGRRPCGGAGAHPVS